MKRTSSILLAVICLITASTCLAQYPVPFVDQPLVPSAVAPASPEFSLTVHGAGFVSGSTVNWNGTPLATTFESAGKLTAAVPAENVSTAGTVNVTVVNPSPGGGSSNPVPFTIIAPTFNPVFNAFPVAGTTSPISVVTADFNHDGIPDLAVIDAAPAPSCNYQNFGVGSIVIFLGNGDGTFTKHSTLCFVDLLGETPRSLAVTGDLNRDGNVDLVAVSNSAGDNGDTLDIYYGNGDGTFTVTDPTAQATSAAKKAATEALTSEPQYIKGLALGDFYGNGQLNIAESQITESWGEVQVFLIPGGLLYGTPPEGGDAGPLVAGDFNGDGVLDLADAACDTEIGAGTCSWSR